MDRKRHFLQKRKQWKNADTPTTFSQTSHKQSYQEVVDLDLSQVLLVMFFMGWGLDGFFRSCYSCRLGISPEYRAHLTGDYENALIKLFNNYWLLYPQTTGNYRKTMDHGFLCFMWFDISYARCWTRIEINSGRRVISKLFRCSELPKTIINTGCVVLLTSK